jgi:hypothetical protein
MCCFRCLPLFVSLPSLVFTLVQTNTAQVLIFAGCRNLIYRHLVEIVLRGFDPSQGLYLYRQTEVQKKGKITYVPQVGFQLMITLFKWNYYYITHLRQRDVRYRC